MMPCVPLEKGHTSAAVVCIAAEGSWLQRGILMDHWSGV